MLTVTTSVRAISLLASPWAARSATRRSVVVSRPAAARAGGPRPARARRARRRPSRERPCSSKRRDRALEGVRGRRPTSARRRCARPRRARSAPSSNASPRSPYAAATPASACASWSVHASAERDRGASASGGQPGPRVVLQVGGRGKRVDHRARASSRSPVSTSASTRSGAAGKAPGVEHPLVAACGPRPSRRWRTASSGGGRAAPPARAPAWPRASPSGCPIASACATARPPHSRASAASPRPAASRPRQRSYIGQCSRLLSSDVAHSSSSSSARPTGPGAARARTGAAGPGRTALGSPRSAASERNASNRCPGRRPARRATRAAARPPAPACAPGTSDSPEHARSARRGRSTGRPRKALCPHLGVEREPLVARRSRTRRRRRPRRPARRRARRCGPR